MKLSTLMKAKSLCIHSQTAIDYNRGYIPTRTRHDDGEALGLESIEQSLASLVALSSVERREMRDGEFGLESHNSSSPITTQPMSIPDTRETITDSIQHAPNPPLPGQGQPLHATASGNEFSASVAGITGNLPGETPVDQDGNAITQPLDFNNSGYDALDDADGELTQEIDRMYNETVARTGLRMPLLDSSDFARAVGHNAHTRRAQGAAGLDVEMGLTDELVSRLRDFRTNVSNMTPEEAQESLDRLSVDLSRIL